MIPNTEKPPLGVSPDFPVDLHSAAARRRTKSTPMPGWAYYGIAILIVACLTLISAFGHAAKAHAADIYVEVTKDDASSIPYAGTSGWFWIPVVSMQSTGSLDTVCMPIGEYGVPSAEGNPISFAVWKATTSSGFPQFEDGVYYETDINTTLPLSNTTTDLGEWQWLCGSFSTPIEFSASDIFAVKGIGAGMAILEGDGYPSPYSYVRTVMNDGTFSTNTSFSGSKTASYNFSVPFTLSNGVPGGGEFGTPGTANLMLAVTEPEAFSTTASTTFDVTIRWQRGTMPVTGYELRFTHLSSGAVDTYTFPLDPEIPQGAIETITETVELVDEGTYSLQATLFSGYSPTTPTLPKVRQYGDGSLLTQFAVVTIDTPFDYDSVPGYTNPNYSATDCELDWDLNFNVGNCLGYLFSPSNAAFAQYRTLTLANSFPFSYAYQFPTIKDALYNNASTDDQAITVEILGGELTFLSRSMVAAVPFAPLLKEMLSAVMWAFLAYALYRMVIKAHDNNTPV